MPNLKFDLPVFIFISSFLLGCGATSQTATPSAPVKNKTVKTQNTAQNLLGYANVGFEKPLDGQFPKARTDAGQINKAEFGLMQEAAKSGKFGLGVVLEKGDFKVQYGIWRLKNKIDASKKYRFEFDVFLLSGHAQFFSQVDNSPWQRSPIQPLAQWQVVGTTIDGQFLTKGKPLNMHIDNIKGKEPGVLLVDNVRLYEIN
ncbi:hypothetical protein [Catenovulum sediminis]|uniref:CBM11 domain-containing protein n=1 Tax=Catenovulum sediminis TaxID=1740262 RepID=A0ABV1RCS5_9ALTE